MAINKARTSPLMKTLIIILAASFVLSIGFAGIGSIPGCSAGPLLPQPGATATDTPASVETTAQLAARYNEVITSREATLAANPKSYDLLVAQAESYLGWALEYANLTKTVPDASSTVWTSAVDLYKRALAIKGTDGTIYGDYAMALFYSGETTAAISAGEKARALDPTGAQNLFNLGNYYSQAGDTAKALEAYKACLAANPDTELATAAQAQITALGGK